MMMMMMMLTIRMMKDHIDDDDNDDDGHLYDASSHMLALKINPCACTATTLPVRLPFEEKGSADSCVDSRGHLAQAAASCNVLF